MTGGQTVSFLVQDAVSLEEGIHMLLRSQAAKQDMTPQQQAVLWQHHVGGDSHEA